ncbi:methyl-accepting chemotaxis protein [Quadrisphaera setariae]|uniref:Methyl-accepting chemotaxis protein n=1 Tax=Quadrisphaera setariae TaxID=2593304 RepID=A0A5C8ZC29_9ACTN|nr:methyl-accepting chemotaxis protein [Quadrisphaera setariae]TXR55347.1 methyl-accepting chemotaxis protein [Quadrisphaera setariae]
MSRVLGVLLRPAERLMDALTFGRKVAVLAACLLLPLGVALHAQLASQGGNIDVAVAEREGLQLVRPALLLLADASAASVAAPADQQAAARAVQEDLRALQAARAGLGSADRSDEQLQALATAVAAATAGGGWDAVLDRAVAFSDAETSRSQLILDPSLDSYFVMDALTAQVPGVLVRASRGAVQAAALTATSPVADRSALAVTAAESATAITATAATPSQDEGASAAAGALAATTAGRAAVTSLADALDDLLADRAADLRQQRAVALAITLGCLAVSLWVALAFLLGTRRRLRSIHGVLTHVAEADFTHRADVGGHDELTAMATKLDDSSAAVADVFAQIAALSAQARASTEEVGGLAAALRTRMSTDAARAQEQAADAGAAAEHVGVATSGGVEVVLAITEITESASRASSAAERARDRVDQAGAAVRELASSAERVGQVVGIIASVADQTNLLALNATIEAARAGEVGKGFAVVAQEVKDLARVTAGATQDIERLVAESAARASHAQALVADLEGDIGQVDEAQGVIAAAVEEQSATGTQMSSVLTTGAQAVERLGASAAQADAAAQRAVQETELLAAASQRLAGAVEQLDGVARRVRT